MPVDRSTCRPRPGSAAAVALVCAALVASATRAETADRDAARAKVNEGVKLLDAGNAGLAITRFEEAYAIVPSPKIIYNMALAYRVLGRYADAFMAFERFLREADSSNSQHLNHARQELERLSKRVAFVTLSCDVSGAEVVVDRRTIGTTPLPGRIALDTGPHTVLVRKSDFESQSRSLTAVAGESFELRIDLRPRTTGQAASPQPGLAIERRPSPGHGDPVAQPLTAAGVGPKAGSDKAPAAAPSWIRTARWVALGGSIAALSAGGYFHLKSRWARNDFDDLGKTDSPPQECGVDGDAVVGGPRCRELANDFDRAKGRSAIAYATGGVLVATTVVLFLMGREPSGEIAVLPGTDGGPLGVSYAARF